MSILGVIVIWSATSFPCALVFNLPKIFDDSLWWHMWRQMNPLIQYFSFSGMYHFFKTVGWYRVVEDDGVGIRMPKYSCSVLSTLQVEPVHCILEHFPLPSMRFHSWLVHVVKFVCLWFVHGIHCCEEYGLPSFVYIFPSCNQT